jgi:hypothetical protein
LELIAKTGAYVEVMTHLEGLNANVNACPTNGIEYGRIWGILLLCSLFSWELNDIQVPRYVIKVPRTIVPVRPIDEMYQSVDTV